MLVSNSISDHEMSFETEHALSIVSGSYWKNLTHIELKPNLPVCLWGIHNKCPHLGGRKEVGNNVDKNGREMEEGLAVCEPFFSMWSL